MRLGGVVGYGLLLAVVYQPQLRVACRLGSLQNVDLNLYAEGEK